MKVENIPISQLKPYEKNNKKHDRKQIANVAESIKQFGFVQPIVADRDNVVVIGHCRLAAAKKIGMVEVPCVRVDGLTDEQVRKLRIVDNKANESEYDVDSLLAELDDLDLSDFDFDFDIDVGEDGPDDDDPEEKENQREYTYKLYNLYYNDLDRVTGAWDMPIIQKQIVKAPPRLASFTNVLNSKNDDDRKAGVHFFSDDYKFERIWKRPDDYARKLTRFYCALTPDFSLYMDMPLATQLWNVYRSRLIGQIMQDNGVIVIPTIQWASERTFDFCFDGIEKGSICAISTIGVKRDAEATEIWRKGTAEMIKRIDPSAIWCYGGDIGYDFGDIPVTYYENENKVRLQSNDN